MKVFLSSFRALLEKVPGSRVHMPGTVKDIELGFNLYRYPEVRRRVKATAVPPLRNNESRAADTELESEPVGPPSGSIGFSSYSESMNQGVRGLLQDAHQFSSASVPTHVRIGLSPQLSALRQTLRHLYPLSPIKKEGNSENAGSSLLMHNGFLSSSGSTDLDKLLFHNVSPPAPSAHLRHQNEGICLCGPQDKNAFCPVNTPPLISSANNGKEEAIRGERTVVSSAPPMVRDTSTRNTQQRIDQKEKTGFQMWDCNTGENAQVSSYNSSILTKAREQTLRGSSMQSAFPPSIFPFLQIPQDSIRRDGRLHSTDPTLSAKNFSAGPIGSDGGSAVLNEETPDSTSASLEGGFTEGRHESGNFSKVTESRALYEQKTLHSQMRNRDEDDCIKTLLDSVVERPFGATLRYLLDVIYQPLESEVVELLEKVQSVVENRQRESDNREPLQSFSFLESGEGRYAREIAVSLGVAALATSRQGVISSLDQLVSNYLSSSHNVITPRSYRRQLVGSKRLHKETAEKTETIVRSSPLGNRLSEFHPAICVPLAVWAEYSLEQMFNGDPLDSASKLKKWPQKIKTEKRSSSRAVENQRLAKIRESEEKQKDQLDKNDRLPQWFQLLDHAIEAGNVGAMHFVGRCLRDGQGLPINLNAGITWIERAARTGYLPAMHEMGEMLENGVQRGDQELDSDWGEAMIWYHRAAERNYSRSQLNLGKLLLLASMQSVTKMECSAEERKRLEENGKRWLNAAASAENLEALHLIERIKE